MKLILKAGIAIARMLWRRWKVLCYTPIIDDFILWYCAERNDPYRITINSLVAPFEDTLHEYIEIKNGLSLDKQGNSSLKLMTSNQRKYTKKKVILFLIHWYELGGAESFALDTLRWANELDMHTIIIATIPCLHANMQSFETFANELYYVDQKGAINHQPFQQFLLAKIAEKKVNIIHIHHSLMGYEILPQIKKKHPNMTIVDTLHIVEYETWHTYNLLLKKNDIFHLEKHGHINFPNGGFPSVSIKFNQYIDQTHVISQTLAKFIIHQGIQQEKITLRYLIKPLSNMHISEAKIRERYLKKFTAKKISIAFIGRLVFQKKPYIFLDLIKKLNKQNRCYSNGKLLLEFHIFGDGEYRTYIEKKEKKITNLKFWGTDVSLKDMLAHSDIVILPSRNEGLPLTSFECALAGVIFFSINVGAQAEFVPAAFLVKNSPFAHRALKRKITHFLNEPAPFIDEVIAWRQKAINLLQYSANKEWLNNFYN